MLIRGILQLSSCRHRLLRPCRLWPLWRIHLGQCLRQLCRGSLSLLPALLLCCSRRDHLRNKAPICWSTHVKVVCIIVRLGIQPGRPLLDPGWWFLILACRIWICIDPSLWGLLSYSSLSCIRGPFPKLPQKWIIRGDHICRLAMRRRPLSPYFLLQLYQLFLQLLQLSQHLLRLRIY